MKGNLTKTQGACGNSVRIKKEGRGAISTLPGLFDEQTSSVANLPTQEKGLLSPAFQKAHARRKELKASGQLAAYRSPWTKLADMPTPIKATRLKCYECSGYSRDEVGRCECVECALWPFRHGKRPTSEDLAKWREPFKTFMDAHTKGSLAFGTCDAEAQDNEN